MDGGIVEFHALADADRARAQHHDLLLVRADALVLAAVAGVEVGDVGAGVQRVHHREGRRDARLPAQLPDRQLVHAPELGDGFIGILTDEKFSCLFDSKENRFFNETDCLTEKFQIDDWQFAELPYDSFGGAVICTDGVSFGENKAEKFTRDFCRENAARPRQAILEDLKGLLTNWKSHDDKTLAFVLPDARR